MTNAPDPQNTPNGVSERLSPESQTADVSVEESFARVPSGEIVLLEDRVRDVPEAERGPLSGRLIQGRYLLRGLLGEGGMGAVYRAEHTLMGKELAIKVLLPELGATPTIVKRFQQEAQSASRLDHPGIIQVYDFGYTEEGMLFLAMAFLAGRSLTDLIAREAPFSAEGAIPLVVQICEALEHAHSQGVVHRDMKPDNVMVLERNGERRTKLLDFGIARVTQGEAAAQGMTQAGMVFGTPEYLSPEQAAGDPADARADLYAVGVILYEMLAGRRPFVADTNVEYIFHHLHDPPPPFREVLPDRSVSPELERVVLRALAKSPGDRFQTARELVDALLALQVVRYVSPGPSLQSIRAIAPRAGVTSPPASRPVATLSPSASPRAAQHDRPAVRRAVVRWGLASLGAIALILVVLLAVVSGDDGRQGTRAQRHLTQAQRAALDGAKALAKAGHYRAAEKKLQALLRSVPRSPQVHLFLGHVQCKEGHREACLGSYQAAMLLAPESRENKALLADLAVLLRRAKGKRWGRPDRQAAVLLVTGAMAGAGRFGPRGRKMLVAWVNSWWEPDLVWKVIEALVRQHADGGVDFLHAYRIRFRGVRDCKKRKRFVLEIVSRGDVSLRKVLEEVYRADSFPMPYSRARVHNACLRPDLARAIELMGGEVPRLAPRRRSARRSSSITRSIRRIFR